MSELIFAPPRLLTPETARALRGRELVLFGAGPRADMRAAAATLGLADVPAVVEGGAAIVLPRAVRGRFACLNGPAWVADGDEAVVEIGRPLSAWSAELAKVRDWVRDAFPIDATGREYTAAAEPPGDEIVRKLEAYAARQDVRLSRVDGAWLLHARFGRAQAFHQLVEYYRGLGFAGATVACGLDEAAPADRIVGSVDEFLAG